MKNWSNTVPQEESDNSPETKIKVMEYCSLTGSAQFFRSVVSDSWDPMNRSTPGLPIHRQLPGTT